LLPVSSDLTFGVFFLVNIVMWTIVIDISAAWASVRLSVCHAYLFGLDTLGGSRHATFFSQCRALRFTDAEISWVFLWVTVFFQTVSQD